MMIIDYGDYWEGQHEIWLGIVDGMGREEREQYFRDQGLTSDGLPMPIDAELVEAADLLRTIDEGGGSNFPAGGENDGRPTE
jgi:hypothetical protein